MLQGYLFFDLAPLQEQGGSETQMSEQD